jgi:hypothetical protein
MIEEFIENVNVAPNYLNYEISLFSIIIDVTSKVDQFYNV